MIFGSRRLWTDETINEVIGIDDRFVSIRGHSNPFVYDMETGALVTDVDPQSITSGDAPFHPSIPVGDIGRHRWNKVSRDGRWAAIGPLGNRLRVYDNLTGAMKFADDPAYAFDVLAFSHDGRRIAGLADGAWVYERDRPGVRVPGIRYGLAFDANDDLIGGDIGKLARWSLDGSERTRVSIRHKVDSLTITSDGTRAAVTTIVTGGLCMAPMPDVVVADLAHGTASLRFHDTTDDVTRRAALSPNGRWLALTDGNGVRLYSAEPRPAWIAPPLVATWPDKQGVMMSPDDRALLFDADGVPQLIDLPSGAPCGERANLDGELSWSPDGRLVEIALQRQHVRFRDPASFAITSEHAFDTMIEAIAISRDGKQLAVTDGPTIQIVAL